MLIIQIVVQYYVEEEHSADENQKKKKKKRRRRRRMCVCAHTRAVKPKTIKIQPKTMFWMWITINNNYAAVLSI